LALWGEQVLILAGDGSVYTIFLVRTAKLTRLTAVSNSDFGELLAAH
jgi:hypothetical protein